MKPTLFALALGLLLLTPPAFGAAAIELFSGGLPVPGYSKLLNRLSVKGGTVRFSDGTEVKIIKKLGQGGTTAVYLSDDGTAVRIPAPGDIVSNMQMLFAFADQHRLLRENGVLIPDIIRMSPVVSNLPENRGLSRKLGLEYVVVEKLEIEFLFSDWLRRLTSLGVPLNQLQGRLPREEWSALLKFARSTWKFAFIPDLKPENIAWTGDKWILFDWTDHNLLFSEQLNFTVFTRGAWRSQDPAAWTTKDWIFDRLEDAARTERVIKGGCPSLLNTFQ